LVPQGDDIRIYQVPPFTRNLCAVIKNFHCVLILKEDFIRELNAIEPSYLPMPLALFYNA